MIKDWAGFALCAQTDPELFFPDKGVTTHEARSLCASCPVKEECLEDALTTGDLHHGIRAGLTPNARLKLFKERGERPCRDCREPVPHGSDKYYCDECRHERRIRSVERSRRLFIWEGVEE